MTSPIEIVDPVRIYFVGFAGFAIVGMGINVSWRHEPQGLDDAAMIFSLRISSGLRFQETLIVHNESTYHYTAPEGAPCTL